MTHVTSDDNKVHKNTTYLPTAAGTFAFLASNAAASRESRPPTERPGGAATNAWASGAAVSIDAASTPATDEDAASRSRIFLTEPSRPLALVAPTPKNELCPPSRLSSLRQSGGKLERQMRHSCKVWALRCCVAGCCFDQGGFDMFEVALFSWASPVSLPPKPNPKPTKPKRQLIHRCVDGNMATGNTATPQRQRIN